MVQGMCRWCQCKLMRQSQKAPKILISCVKLPDPAGPTRVAGALARMDGDASDAARSHGRSCRRPRRTPHRPAPSAHRSPASARGGVGCGAWAEAKNLIDWARQTRQRHQRHRLKAHQLLHEPGCHLTAEGHPRGGSDLEGHRLCHGLSHHRRGCGVCASSAAHRHGPRVRTHAYGQPRRGHPTSRERPLLQPSLEPQEPPTPPAERDPPAPQADQTRPAPARPPPAGWSRHTPRFPWTRSYSTRTR